MRPSPVQVTGPEQKVGMYALQQPWQPARSQEFHAQGSTAIHPVHAQFPVKHRLLAPQMGWLDGQQKSGQLIPMPVPQHPPPGTHWSPTGQYHFHAPQQLGNLSSFAAIPEPLAH